MDIWGPKLIWCGIICHVIIQMISVFFFRIMESCRDKNAIHAMTKLHVVKKNLSLFFVDFVNKKMWILFAMMYMFVYYICTRYINAHTHQGLNQRPHGSTLGLNHQSTSRFY